MKKWRLAVLFVVVAVALPGCAAFQSIAPATKQVHALEAKKAEEVKIIAEQLLGRMNQGTPEEREAVLIAALTIRENWQDYVRLHVETAAALNAPPVVTEQQIGSVTELIRTIMRKEKPSP